MVTRYAIQDDLGYKAVPCLATFEHSKGDWVKWEDHVEIVRQWLEEIECLKQEIRELR